MARRKYRIKKGQSMADLAYEIYGDRNKAYLIARQVSGGWYTGKMVTIDRSKSLATDTGMGMAAWQKELQHDIAGGYGDPAKMAEAVSQFESQFGPLFPGAPPVSGTGFGEEPTYTLPGYESGSLENVSQTEIDMAALEMSDQQRAALEGRASRDIAKPATLQSIIELAQQTAAEAGISNEMFPGVPTLGEMYQEWAAGTAPYRRNVGRGPLLEDRPQGSLYLSELARQAAEKLYGGFTGIGSPYRQNLGRGALLDQQLGGESARGQLESALEDYRTGAAPPEVAAQREPLPPQRDQAQRQAEYAQYMQDRYLFEVVKAVERGEELSDQTISWMESNGLIDTLPALTSGVAGVGGGYSSFYSGARYNSRGRSSRRSRYGGGSPVYGSYGGAVVNNGYNWRGVDFES